MNILTLSIKQKYFDQIVSGEKKEENREIRPNTFAKYARYICDGVESETDCFAEDAEVDVKLIKYGALKLLTGAYSGKRPWVLVEVKDAEMVILQDEEGNDIVYEHEGKEYIAAEVCYHLGDIIDKSNY